MSANKALIRWLHEICRSFPDWREDSEDLLEEGDRVVSRSTSTGTRRGEFWGVAPTGRRVTVPEISIDRIEQGQVAEPWCMLDELVRMQQLGARRPRPGE